MACRAASASMMSIGVAALALNTACYAYTAEPASQLAPGQPVVVAVNDAGRSAIAPSVGDSVAQMQANFVSNDVAGIHVKVTDVQFQSGISSPRSSVPVTLSQGMIDSVSTRKFAVASTAWIVAGIIAGLVILVKSVDISSSGTSPAPITKPPQGGGN